MKLKKQSGASSKSKPPSPPVLFIDRSLGKHVIPHALRNVGAPVETHDDHFPPDAKDEEWLSEVGKRGWVVLTKDRRIRYRTPALTAIMNAKVRAFVLTAGDLQGSEMAEIFVKALPVITRLTARNPPPFIARVTKSGAVSIIQKGTKRR